VVIAHLSLHQGNPTGRFVNIGPVTAVAATAAGAPDLAGSRRKRAGEWSADVISVRLALLTRLTARRGGAGYVN
jgi:hypothetical protein